MEDNNTLMLEELNDNGLVENEELEIEDSGSSLLGWGIIFGSMVIGAVGARVLPKAVKKAKNGISRAWSKRSKSKSEKIEVEVIDSDEDE